MFLLFVTGCSRPPAGGFSALEDKFVITRLTGINNFPIAHTCFNNLELPDYNDEALLESKLLYAIRNTETFELG